MIACAVSDEGSGRPVPPAAAGGPAFPSLKKDNCIRNGRHRSVFTAQENIRLYIWKHGPEKIGFLTVTTPSECLELSAFQEKWHSYLTNVIRKTFPTGMWARERQPRSGNWHAHAVVNVGRDIWTGFPFDQVAKKFYANVDSELRKLWKHLRETAAAHGFGRTELLPLKHSGEACARYITDYLAGVRLVLRSQLARKGVACLVCGAAFVSSIRGLAFSHQGSFRSENNGWLRCLNCRMKHASRNRSGPAGGFILGRRCAKSLCPRIFTKSDRLTIGILMSLVCVL